MSLVSHAKSELEQILTDPDLIMCYLEVVSAYAAKAASGEPLDPDILASLFKGHAVGPITNDPSEWSTEGKGQWTNNRDPRIVSDDGGRTYFILPDYDALTDAYERHVSAHKEAS